MRRGNLSKRTMYMSRDCFVAGNRNPTGSPSLAPRNDSLPRFVSSRNGIVEVKASPPPSPEGEGADLSSRNGITEGRPQPPFPGRVFTKRPPLRHCEAHHQTSHSCYPLMRRGNLSKRTIILIYRLLRRRKL
jgi:hypothetical protein